jgi:hypothetical protein
MFNKFFSENCAGYEIMWDNMRAGQATDTPSEYVILIAFPRQQWRRERTSLRLYVQCLAFSFLQEISSVQASDDNFACIYLFLACQTNLFTLL